MNKFHESDIVAVHETETFREYEVNNLKVSRLECCICGKRPWGRSKDKRPLLSEKHTVKTEGYYCVLPNWHDACICKAEKLYPTAFK